MGYMDIIHTEISIRDRATLTCQRCNKKLSLCDSRTSYIYNTDTIQISVRCHGEEETYVLPPTLFKRLVAEESETVSIDFFPIGTPRTAMTDIAGLIWEKRDA